MAHRVDAGTLELGGGLEALVHAALESVPVGGELEVVTASRGVAFELPAWARIAGHEPVGEAVDGRGPGLGSSCVFGAAPRRGCSRRRCRRAATRPLLRAGS